MLAPALSPLGMLIALPNTLVDAPLFLNAAVDECDIFFVFTFPLPEELNELSPERELLPAGKSEEEDDFVDFEDVRKSSAALVTRSVRDGLACGLALYDVDAI
jgi:hypothetical protein